MKNASVKNSLEKSKNVLEEKRKMVKRKTCIKNQHVYNNCYERRSRAIKNPRPQYGRETLGLNSGNHKIVNCRSAFSFQYSSVLW